jgi:hypothetical protein
MNVTAMKTATTGLLLTAALLGTGCASTHGNKQAEAAPRLVESNKVIAWDRGEAFGPVPLRLAGLAALHCAALDTRDLKWQPEGFHAGALDLDGKPFSGGGYFCKSRPKS